MRSKFKLLFAFLMIGALLSGCIGVNQSFRQIRREVMSEVGEQFEKEFEFSIGPAGLLFAGIAVSFVDTDVDVPAMVRKLSRVQVSVYKNTTGEVVITKRLVDSIKKKMEDNGWGCLVKVRERNEMSLVFVQGDEEELRQMFVIAVSDDEFVMTEALGDLGGLISLALRDKGLKMEIAGG